MKVVKKGKLPIDRQLLSGTCDRCSSEVQVDTSIDKVSWTLTTEPKEKSIPYIECPTRGCGKTILLSRVS